MKTSSHLNVNDDYKYGIDLDTGVMSYYKLGGNIMQSVIVIGFIAFKNTDGLHPINYDLYTDYFPT